MINLNRKREGADVPVWTVELDRVCSHLHEVSAPRFFHALCTRLPYFCNFLGFPHSFVLYSLGRLTSSLSNIPGRQSCVCRHCFARAPPVWSVPAFDWYADRRKAKGAPCSPRWKVCSEGWAGFSSLKQKPGSSCCHSQTDTVSLHFLRNRCVNCSRNSLSEIMRGASTWEILVRKKINGKTMFQSIASVSNLLLKSSSAQRWNLFHSCFVESHY